MFVHSGASLHGHQFSPQSSSPGAAPTNRRNVLLRSAFATSPSRATTHQDNSPSSFDHQPSPSEFNKSKTLAESPSRLMDAGLLPCEEPKVVPPTSQPEAMSEDEGSVTGSDVSRVSSVRRSRRISTRASTTYVLAHPPPKLRTKQRILHVRPNLLLQMQQVPSGQRPTPIIDVYPASVFARSIVAPLLKRFPRVARIKRELGIQDIMLVKSEDYALRHSGSDSDGDEDGIMSRELLAILSPLQAEDKAEIVLADGTIWVAKTRSNGNAFSYEFVSVDAGGHTTTVRWVRRQVAPTSFPGTPTTPVPSPAKSQSPDYKFTFSVIDPDCRRHPILATLTSSSLSICDSYTTVSQSANKHPPTSTVFPPLKSSSGSEPVSPERRTRPVEEWHKSLIMISAVWVTLRHGWAPNFRPEDLLPSRAATDGVDASPGRRRSCSASADSSPTSVNSEQGCRRKNSSSPRAQELRSASGIPRRATSTGAAFIQKRRAIQHETGDQSIGSAQDRPSKFSRRALSGDWHLGLKRTREKPLSEIADISPPSSPDQSAPKLAPVLLPSGRRTVSVYAPCFGMADDRGASPNEVHEYLPDLELEPTSYKADENTMKSKFAPRWKNMTNWFRKFSAR
ncbi:hypothetical protein GGR57DRAFT_470098 [Xylariaceae sp. FL1272]|nr:hypothetical protein GGR57DRAFT_470098 [Xylariaceae sp. FL1272]